MSWCKLAVGVSSDLGQTFNRSLMHAAVQLGLSLLSLFSCFFTVLCFESHKIISDKVTDATAFDFFPHFNYVVY